MKIAYLGIDLLKDALFSIIDEHTILKIFTSKTDNITEFNSEIISASKKRGIAFTDEKITSNDLEKLADEGCQLLLCAGYYHKVPFCNKFPMINIHPAPLPDFRGAWPMPVLLLEGHTAGAVAFHKMEEKFDTGDIIMQESFTVDEKETLQSYMKKVSYLLPSMTKKLINDLPNLLLSAAPQSAGRYIPLPTMSQYTITHMTDKYTADKILRAFFGYECIYKNGDKEYEIIGGYVTDTKDENTLPIKDGYIKFEKCLSIKSSEPDFVQFHSR